MNRLYCVLIGYCIGMIQIAYIYGKIKGVDLRKQGSGNLGSTNTLRTFGNKSGFLVLCMDALKMGLSIVATWLIFGTDPDYFPLLILYTALGTILGHDFPFYLHFKGGKGVASTIGLALFLDAWLVPIPLLTFIIIVATTHYVSLGSLLAYLALFLNYVALGQFGLITDNLPVLYESYGIFFVLMLLAYLQHITNIKRLINHTERKTYLSKKKKEAANE